MMQWTALELVLLLSTLVFAIGWMARKWCSASVTVPVPGPCPPRAYRLCPTCEANQARKIRQLASFTPVHRRAFNSEVEAYQRDLERVYKLCPRCERTVEKRLRQVQAFVQQQQQTTTSPRTCSTAAEKKKPRMSAVSPILIVALVSVLAIGLFCEYLRTEADHREQYLARIRNHRLEVATVTDLLLDLQVGLQEALDMAQQRTELEAEAQEEEIPTCAARTFPWN